LNRPFPAAALGADRFWQTDSLRNRGSGHGCCPFLDSDQGIRTQTSSNPPPTFFRIARPSLSPVVRPRRRWSAAINQRRRTFFPASGFREQAVRHRGDRLRPTPSRPPVGLISQTAHDLRSPFGQRRGDDGVDPATDNSVKSRRCNQIVCRGILRNVSIFSARPARGAKCSNAARFAPSGDTAMVAALDKPRSDNLRGMCFAARPRPRSLWRASNRVAIRWVATHDVASSCALDPNVVSLSSSFLSSTAERASATAGVDFLFNKSNRRSQIRCCSGWSVVDCGESASQRDAGLQALWMRLIGSKVSGLAIGSLVLGVDDVCRQPRGTLNLFSVEKFVSRLRGRLEIYTNP